jgi:hypothetical protein
MTLVRRDLPSPSAIGRLPPFIAAIPHLLIVANDRPRVFVADVLVEGPAVAQPGWILRR